VLGVMSRFQSLFTGDIEVRIIGTKLLLKIDVSSRIWKAPIAEDTVYQWLLAT
jgi:hypothetical protein